MSMIKPVLLAGSVFLLPVTPAPAWSQSLDWSEESSLAVSQAVEADTYGTVTSLLVLSGGEPVYEAYFQDTDATTLHDTRSVTKTVTSMAVGAAIADGALALDSPVADFFPELMPFANPDPRKFEVTVEDLLTMSGPLECNDWNEFSRGNEERMYLVENWSAFFWDLPVRGFPAWQTPPEDSPYGRAFSYCTAGVQLLGEVVARATGEAFTDYAERRILMPLGIDALEWAMNGQGQAHMGGGLRLTTQALGALGELYRRDGADILPQDWVEASLAHHAAIPDTPGWEYGYLWWLMPYEVDGQRFWAAAMTGNGGNRVMILPDFGVTLVFTNTDFNTRQMHQNAQAFFETEIVARLQAGN
ncbi:serine hydrolase domain-containing protein [Maricaulis parjimensis]|uniref:serine hydrolase domain-containing protein n=1 Tax=Maricaulis parjimensis TaxID=144023 RepID=UPI001939B82C|nr:serine hydrolase [Maricaulis parjimensis]